jgi:putative ABC transport system permease protein
LQLLLVGYTPPAVFELSSSRFGNYAITAVMVTAATGVTIAPLLTAIRPHPLWDPHYAIELAGIILGSVLNAGSLSLDSMLEGSRSTAARSRPNSHPSQSIKTPCVH